MLYYIGFFKKKKIWKNLPPTKEARASPNIQFFAKKKKKDSNKKKQFISGLKKHVQVIWPSQSWVDIRVQKIPSFLPSPPSPTNPTNNALLINFLLSSDAEIFVSKHRLSIQIGAKRAKKRVCNVYVFRLGFHFAHHCWWLGSR